MKLDKVEDYDWYIFGIAVLSLVIAGISLWWNIFRDCNDINRKKLKRRKAIEDIRKSAKVIEWAIDQSKYSKALNTPKYYKKQLKKVYDSLEIHNNKKDVELLDPLILDVIDPRKTFPDLESPLKLLLEAIDGLDA